MDINPNSRPAASESAAIINSSLASDRFKERQQRDVQSDVTSEVVFYSPVIKIDRDTQAAVMQYRDTKTGEVRNEFPNKAVANVYAKADATVEKPEARPAARTDDPVDGNERPPANARPVPQEPVAKIDEDV